MSEIVGHASIIRKNRNIHYIQHPSFSPKMILQCLKRLFPDFVECFFPVNKDDQHRFRWPGIEPALRCLLLEAMCFSLGIILLVVMTLGYGFLLVTGLACDTRAIPGLPSATSSRRGEAFAVTKLDASKAEVTPATIRSFMTRSEPVIIKNLPKETFSAFAPGGQYATPITKEIIKRGNFLINTYLFPRSLGCFGKWIQKNVQKPMIAVVRISGYYKTSAAHMDGSPPTNNIYHLSRGRKRVWICPRQYNHLLNLESIADALVVPGSEPTSSEPLEWIQSVPGVWVLDLEEGDILVFHETACVHKFENLTENPEAFAVKVLGCDGSPAMAKHWIFNWEQARKQAWQISSWNKTVVTAIWRAK